MESLWSHCPMINHVLSCDTDKILKNYYYWQDFLCAKVEREIWMSTIIISVNGIVVINF